MFALNSTPSAVRFDTAKILLQFLSGSSSFVLSPVTYLFLLYFLLLLVHLPSYLLCQVTHFGIQQGLVMFSDLDLETTKKFQASLQWKQL